MMSKIRNLLDKLKKKKKNSQDLDEIFYDQNEVDENSDEEDQLGEETVIFSDDDESHELKPHPSATEDPNTPAKSDLVFPKERKTPQKKEHTEVSKPNLDLDHTKHSDLALPSEDNATRELDISSLKLDQPQIPGEEDLEIPSIDFGVTSSDEQSTNENPENYEYDPRLDLTHTTVSGEEDFEYDETAVREFDEQSVNFNDDASQFEFEDINQLTEMDVENESDPDEGFDYTFGNKTFTSEIDLDDGKVSLKDKIDHLGTRIVDRFRIMNKKDLNQVMKPPRDKTSPSTRIQVEKLKSKVQEVQWNKFIDRILNPEKNQSIHHYFQIIIAVFFIYSLANLIGSFIKGKPDYTNSGKGSPIVIDSDKMLQNSDIDKVRLSNVFKTTQNVVADNKPVQTKPKIMEKCIKGDSKSSLPIELHHTIVLQDSVKSVASVTVRSQKMSYIREGDKINTMAKIDRIDPLELVIRNMQTGNCEFIKSSAAKDRPTTSAITLMPKNKANAFKQQLKEVKGISNDGNNFTVERAVLQEKLQDINSLLKQARAIQINNPDGTLSFKIVEIEPDSVFANLGIQNGDVISSIGGEPIQNLNQIMGMFGKITNMNSLKLGLSRDGEEFNQNYTIK